MKKILLAVLTAGSLMSAQAAIHQYVLNFAPEGAVISPGTGSGTVNYDDVNHLLQLQATFSGLVTENSTGVTISHIHAATTLPFTGNAGVATTLPTLAGFPAGVYSGTYSNTLDLTQAGSWNSAFIDANGQTTLGAEAALFTAMNEGKSYWNIHTQANPGGEIRGWITLVPEPSSFALAGLGLAALAGWARSRQRTVNL